MADNTPIIDPSTLTMEQKEEILKKFADAVDRDSIFSIREVRIASRQTQHVLVWLFGKNLFKEQ